MLHLLLLLLLLLAFFGDANRQPRGEADRRAEILRGLLRLDLPAAFLRVLVVIVENRGDAERRAYASRRRMVTA